MLFWFAAPPVAGVRGRSCQPGPFSISNQAYLRLPTYPSQPQDLPTIQRLPGWRPVPALPLVGGGRWAGPGAWRTSKLACGEGWPCFAGRRLVLPDGGLQLLPGEGSRRSGSGKPAARAAPPSLGGARAGSGWGNTSSLAPMRAQVRVVRCGMLGTEALSFVRGRRWGRCGPRGRARTGRQGAAGATVEFWSLSS